MTAWLDWDDLRVRAACARTRNHHAWELDTVKGRHMTYLSEDNHAAVRVCRTCPVRRRCAEFALATWPVGLICAGVAVHNDRHGQPAPDAVRALQQITGVAA